MIVYLAILLANGAVYLGANAFPLALGESFAIALLYLLALLGAVFLFSSMFKNSLYAVLVVAVLFLFGFSLIQGLITALVKIEPWFIITYAQNVISYPFLSTLPAHVTTTTGPRGFRYDHLQPDLRRGVRHHDRVFPAHRRRRTLLLRARGVHVVPELAFQSLMARISVEP